MRIIVLAALVAFGLVGPAAAGGLSDAKYGLEVAMRGSYALAIRYYTRAIWSREMSERNVAITYYNRGVTHARLQDYEEALTDYTSAIEVRPDYAQAYYNRGVTHELLGEISAAISDYDSAIGLHYPEIHKALFNRGAAYEGQGELQRAMADFEAAYRHAPDEVAIRTKLEDLGLLE